MFMHIGYTIMCPVKLCLTDTPYVLLCMYMYYILKWYDFVSSYDNLILGLILYVLALH